ncbi:peptide/nickel ABC substrate-binding lipoprotein [Pontimonas salivibrio]|uniref:Peptide/nickel ABC substrate-binding lipoprotein n=1 Tax=Pontimonas salivibrio TaxID=1159327 RepID=A0A2L2BQ49_9MICO|nr:ABC transporter substrate-binding protein [Pontimonas salivibrio]AVG23732.1 peptide/nickel ABC substrate-binding lipoprotein [Pontimonas salivibrio]
MSTVSRRTRSLLSVGASAALVIGLGACAAEPSGVEQAGDAASRSTLTFAIEGGNLSAGHMDIHSSQLDVAALVLRNSFDSLVAQDTSGNFVPWLAESWTISEDELQYTFTLRQDVTFHDGEPFNAEAVKANFDHVVAPETASAQAASLIGFAEEGGYYEGTEVLSEYEVAVNFRQPYAPFLQGLSLPQLGFYSPKVLEESAEELKAGGPGITVGTGPFILQEYTPDQELVFTANPDYNWAPAHFEHQGRAVSDVLTIAIVPETASRVGAINAGDVDVAADFTPDMAAQVREGVSTYSVEMPGIPYSLYINEGHGVFADERVREAFSIGFDAADAIDSIYLGQFSRAWSVLGPTTPNAYDESLEQSWPYDPEKANELLDEAGWTGRDEEGYRTKDGERLSARWIVYTPVPDDRASLANFIQSDLQDIGFELVREVLEPAQYMEFYGPREFDVADWSFSGPDADVLRSHLQTGGYQTVSTVSKPEIDQLLSDAVATSAPEERERIYQRIQQWNAQNNLIVPLFVPSEITVASDTVEGLEFDLYGRALFYGAIAGQ